MTIIRNTPSTSGINTPTTSLAPSIVDTGPKTKLTLAIRKNLRDRWESKQVERAIIRIEEFIKEYGTDGIEELNKQASSHIITIAPTSDPGIEYSACEISNGFLSLLFSKGNLGVNIDRATEGLADALNRSETPPTSEDLMLTRFLPRFSVDTQYAPYHYKLKARLEKAWSVPDLTISPIPVPNFAKLYAYKPEKYDFPRDWQKHFGSDILQYFEALADTVDELGFEGDKMLQEAFKEAVKGYEVQLRVVDELVKGEYNECVVEDGVLYLQTTAQHWTVNVRDTARGLIDVL